MRGNEKQQEEMFACGGLGERVAADHPLRRIRVMTDAGLGELKPELEARDAGTGRAAIPPGQMLRALLLQMLYTVRSSGCWSSRWSTTCCSAGSLVWAGTAE